MTAKQRNNARRYGVHLHRSPGAVAGAKLPTASVLHELAQYAHEELVILRLRQPGHGDGADHTNASDDDRKRAAVRSIARGIEQRVLFDGAPLAPVKGAQ